jgi:nucleoside-diphosphate-sugar epimerase
MDIFLTGGSGYIGSHVLKALTARGDGVRALARSDESAAAVEAAGATAVRGEVTDGDLLRVEAERADAVIHTASPGDETSAEADRVAVEAFASAKRHVHSGGCWSFGNTHGGADEDAPLHPPAMTAWRTELEEQVLSRGGVIVMPGVVYGENKGLLPTIFGEGRYVGNGEYHVALVHVEDVAQVYVLALDAPAGVRLAAITQCLQARDVAGAMAAEARSETLHEFQQRVGEPLAEAMTLDQRVTPVRTRGLGWKPSHADALAELAAG